MTNRPRKVVGASLLLCLVCLLPGCRGLERRGEQCLRLGDYRNALFFFDQAVKRSPESVRARLGLSRAALQHCMAMERSHSVTDTNWQEAAERFEQVLGLRQNAPVSAELAFCYFRLSKAQSGRGDSANALKSALQCVLYDDTSAQYLTYAAILCHRTGNVKQASDLFRRAYATDSTDATALFNLGILAWMDGAYVEAYRWWAKALRQSPRDRNIQYWFAMAEVKMQRMPGATGEAK